MSFKEYWKKVKFWDAIEKVDMNLKVDGLYYW